MKHKTKQRWDKKSTRKEEGFSWSTRRSRALDKEQRREFERLRRNKEIALDIIEPV